MENNNNNSNAITQESVKNPPRSTLVSHNIVVSGHRTSVRLEPEMWEGLREICRRERANMHQICTTVFLQKLEETSLTAAIRVFIMRYYRQAATEDGHVKAGHGYGLTLGLSMGVAHTSHAGGIPAMAAAAMQPQRCASRWPA
jgi:predicted DNA-binding ribbon-helix-helix protein